MVERGEDFDLPLEPSQALAIGGERLRKHFDGDGAFEMQIPASVYLPHAARADLGGYFVGTESVCQGPRPFRAGILRAFA